jgi:D-tyrosyl-tRNA(Tyr) deacylase
MRAVLQRVLSANVQVDRVIVGQIEQGWLVLLGVEQGDTVESVRWLAEKTVNLRAFADDQGKMNRSVLAGDCRKGRRPSFDRAAVPEEARKLYELFCDQVASMGVHVERGIFQADMQVTLVNDGPVTFVIDHPQ